MHFEQCLDKYEHNTVMITETRGSFFNKLQL